jgi:hypothetical protein
VPTNHTTVRKPSISKFYGKNTLINPSKISDNTVIYGVASAAFLVAKTAQQLAYDKHEDHPIGLNSLS